MSDERWAELKTQTWFRAEQDEITAYVEDLRANLDAAVVNYEHQIKLAQARVAELEAQQGAAK